MDFGEDSEVTVRFAGGRPSLDLLLFLLQVWVCLLYVLLLQYLLKAVRVAILPTGAREMKTRLNLESKGR